MAAKATARSAALALIRAVMETGQTLAEAEPALLAPLAPADRARAGRLARATLRRVDPCDRVLAPRLRKTPPPAVQALLRLALTELSLGAAPHGVVNEAVALARADRKTTHLAGLVNAVLRGLPEGDPLAGQPVQKLPRWLRQPLVHAWGREAVAGIEAVQAGEPPVDLTPRAGAADLPVGEALPTGSLRLREAGQLSALPGYAAGQWWVQDAAAALAARLLAPRPGERVLDACAAPGGKTLQLADAGADVTALDISAARMARLAENLARTGLPARMVVADALDWQPETPFDAILLDAPCSATGTIRRHPDLPYAKDGSELAGLVALQAQLIDRCLGWLKPGGRLVFCTCSILPEEGEGQLDAALARHPGLRVQRVDLAGVDPDWWTAAGGLRLRPDFWADRGGLDGFFLVRLDLPRA